MKTHPWVVVKLTELVVTYLLSFDNYPLVTIQETGPRARQTQTQIIVVSVLFCSFLCFVFRDSARRQGK